MAIDPKNYPHLLGEGFRRTSPECKSYNCIAWAAAADKKNWWWPPGSNGSYWPENIRNDNSVEAFTEMFESLGYEQCQTSDIEGGYEKVALYTKNGKSNGEPAHAARSVASGKWTHKIGRNVDIETTLKGVQDSLTGYGRPVIYFRRKIQNDENA